MVRHGNKGMHWMGVSVGETGSTAYYIGATLWQVYEHGRRGFAIASRFLCMAEKNYAISQLEFLAVKWTIAHFKFYQLGRRFLVETDHKDLESLES